MTKPVFLHYTQQELDRNFDQRGWVPNALEVIERFSARSRETRARLEHRANVPYGPGDDETLDIFPAPRSRGRAHTRRVPAGLQPPRRLRRLPRGRTRVTRAFARPLRFTSVMTLITNPHW